jgi:uncharacterized protein (TIGR00369 family)
MIEREIPNYWKGQCFGCSRTNTRGLGLRFWHLEQGCYTRCSIPDYLCGMDGLAHGGIIAFLLDEVAQWAMIAHIGRMGLTREIAVRYLKPVPTDTEVVVAGKIITQDGKEVEVRSTMHSNDNLLLAESKSKWHLARISTIAKMSKVDELTLQNFFSQ